MTILCTVCGTANPEGTTYCEGCGVELSAASASTPVAPAAAAAPGEETGASAAVDLTAATEATPEVNAAALPDTSAETVTPPEAAPTEIAPEEAAPVGGEFTEATAPEMASETAVSAEVAASAAPVTETPPAAPVLTGEAKLGIKKFGAPTGEFIPLQGERLVVGRFDASSGPVDIDLSGLGGQEHISRRHAELYRDQGTWSVRDLGSTNGVYIKRKGETSFSPRLQEPAALSDGDELAFGNLMLTFQQS
ncbi:FHA domain-containing protein [Deinococcus aquatilis]|uniref:FHA domain-containing protein n=1 Tax=Deinococcus aquatilis TaxID=519440 RepID=UPI0003629FF3|nr:FHA domain-containing protein [Deinococcus aquatilis]